MAADLTDAARLRDVETHAADGPPLDIFSNNAGFGGYMPFLQLEPDRTEVLIRLQVVAVTRLTHAALPAMVRRGTGAIINVSSPLAFSAALPALPLPFRATFAAAKAYINTFTVLLGGAADPVCATCRLWRPYGGARMVGQQHDGRKADLPG